MAMLAKTPTQPDCGVVFDDPLFGAIVTLSDGDPGDLEPGGIVKVVAAVEGVKVAATAVTTTVTAAVTVGVTVAVTDTPPPDPPAGNTDCGPDNESCSGNVGCDGNTSCSDNSKCYGNTRCNDNDNCEDQNACPPADGGQAMNEQDADSAGETAWW